MALYNEKVSYLTSTNSDAFDKIYKPGELTPFSGVYRCNSCGVEIVSEEKKPFPPTRACPDHHPNKKAGEVRWKLNIYANHKGS